MRKNYCTHPDVVQYTSYLYEEEPLLLAAIACKIKLLYIVTAALPHFNQNVRKYPSSP